ncbi:TTPAL protein, partial [Acromyrmex charruanus]
MASIKLVSFEEELKKNPELKESDIQILREWCKKQTHLPKISDSELTLFLHSNYYLLEPTKTTIDIFFTIRTHVPEFFCNRDLKALYTEGTCNGHILILDMKNMSLGHVARINPMTLKKFFYYLQDGLPVRLKAFHVINVSPVVDIIFNMSKPFIKKQLLDMFHLHTTNDALENFVSFEILPNEAGGQAGPMMELHNKQMKKLTDHIT